MNVLLPALGMPSSPTSASTFSSRCSLRFSPSPPGVHWRGARLMLDLKCRLPSPPLPPRATTACWSCAARSARRSPVSASVTTVPTGTRSTMSGAPLPYWSAPRPFSPRFARWMRAKR